MSSQLHVAVSLAPGKEPVKKKVGWTVQLVLLL